MRSDFGKRKARAPTAKQHYVVELKDGTLADGPQCHSVGRSTKPVNRENTPLVISDPFSGSQWILSYATAINDNGVIVGYG